jgi:hypothetical protein
MNKKEIDRTWTTKSELTFIKGLGTWTDKKKNRLGLLKKYQNTINLRSKWGSIDDVDVREYVDKLVMIDIKALYK